MAFIFSELELVQTSDADLVIRSSDNVIFQVHKRNLECAADGFFQYNEAADDGSMSLTKSGAILEILLQFIYPRPLPDLEKLEFEDLLLVSEAAEKYGFFGAIYACQLSLRYVLISVNVYETNDLIIFTIGSFLVPIP